MGAIKAGSPTERNRMSRADCTALLITGEKLTEQKFLNAYIVDLKYVRDLSKADSRVMSISPQVGKEMRPFIGIVVIANDKKYCVPLTSPKDKFKVKSKEDFIKIPDPKLKDENGAARTIGILNLNNMIPVSDEVISKIEFSTNSKLSKSAKQLLINELKWCRDNVSVISNRANKLYRKVTETPEKDRNLTRRCCNFKKLEAVLEKRLEKELEQQAPAQNSLTSNKSKSQSKAPFSVSKLKSEAQRIHNQSRNSTGKNKSHKKDDHSL